MFVVSKLYWLLAQPLSLAFFLIFISIIAGWFRLQRARGWFAGLAALLLFVTLFTTTGGYLLQILETRFPRPASEPADLKCMIVLGGAFETEVTTTRGGYEVNQAGDRFIEALRLALRHPESRILTSGGDGSITGRYEGDAAVADRFFPAFGIDSSRLIDERQSRTTYENAIDTKVILDREGLKNCLLITSAFHMPRSVGLFRKLGIEVIPWPTDYRSTGNTVLGLDFTQPSRNAEQTATSVREWTGLLSYYLMGRTHSLYPKPD